MSSTAATSPAPGEFNLIPQSPDPGQTVADVTAVKKLVTQ